MIATCFWLMKAATLQGPYSSDANDRDTSALGGRCVGPGGDPYATAQRLRCDAPRAQSLRKGAGASVMSEGQPRDRLII